MYRVDILFKTTREKEFFNSDKKLTKKFGANCCKIVRKRLDDLYAAENLSVMRGLPGRCHELSHNRKGQISIDAEQPLRLIFEVAEEEIPRLASGGLDWTRVRKIRILEITDTHE